MLTGNYLAVFYMDKQGPRWLAWQALSEAERKATDQKGLAAMTAWEEAHRDAIVYDGGPLGPTKRTSPAGDLTDVVNQLTVFMVIRAPSHEAAARMLEDHPHMTIFPCHAVEVMPLLAGDMDETA